MEKVLQAVQVDSFMAMTVGVGELKLTEPKSYHNKSQALMYGLYL